MLRKGKWIQPKYLLIKGLYEVVGIKPNVIFKSKVQKKISIHRFQEFNLLTITLK